MTVVTVVVVAAACYRTLLFVVHHTHNILRRCLVGLVPVLMVVAAVVEAVVVVGLVAGLVAGLVVHLIHCPCNCPWNLTHFHYSMQLEARIVLIPKYLKTPTMPSVFSPSYATRLFLNSKFSVDGAI
ncbi:MAG: hypothetical protein JSV54_08585 [Chloroflexota bacterium]|nr:MAG: hypothetical protein JSV54_08585 [Chloroflexota bacterium]